MTPRKTSSPTEPEIGGVPETETPPVPRVIGRSQTTPDRDFWEIDGKLYEVRMRDDFGVAAQQRLNLDGREFYQLWTTPDLTADQQARMEQLLDRMFFGDRDAPSLIDAPKALLRKLGAGTRSDVVQTFILAPLQQIMLAAAQAEIETEKAGTGEPMTAS